MIGTALGPYKIIEQIGAGGMGEVYLGEDKRLGRKVAIKVLPEDLRTVQENNRSCNDCGSLTRRITGRTRRSLVELAPIPPETPPSIRRPPPCAPR